MPSRYHQFFIFQQTISTQVALRKGIRKHSNETFVNDNSSYYCCSGKVLIVTYSDCVPVALIIQHAMRMRLISILSLNKPTRCNWAVTFFTALLDYSTCFGRLLQPSSGAQLYMQPLAQVTPRITAFLRGQVEFKLGHVGRRLSEV